MTEPNVQPTPQTVAIKGPDGSIYEVPKDKLSELPEGASVATNQEYAHAKAVAEYGGVGGALAQGAVGFASGLTFGASTAAAMEAAKAFGKENEARQTFQGLEDANPNAGIVGNVASLLVPGLGEIEGLGAAAKGAKYAGALQRGAIGAGRIAEHAAEQVVGRGAENAVLRAGQSAVRHAAGAATEGALFGGGQALSDAYINDPDHVAESVLTGLGHGAILGAGVGGVLGGAAELGAHAFSGLGGIAAKKLEGSTFSQMLEDKAGESAFRAIGAQKPIARAAERGSENGVAEAGRRIMDKVPEYTGKAWWKTTREELGDVAERWMSDANSKLDEVLSKAGRASDVLPTAADIVGDIDDITGRLEQRAMSGPSISKLNQFKEDIQRITGIYEKRIVTGPNGQAKVVDELTGYKPLTPKEFRSFRRDADNIAYQGKLNPELSGFKEFFGELRGKLEDRLVNGIDAAAKTIDEPGLKKAYLAAKKDWQAANWLSKASENTAAQRGGNLGVTLTQKFAGHAAGVAGSIVGGPAGFFLGEALGHAGAHLARAHGEFIASEGLRKLATMGAAENMSIGVNNKIAEGVSGFLRGARGETSTYRVHKDSIDHYMARAATIQQLASNPDAMLERIDRRLGPLAQSAPNLAASLSKKAANDVQFLATKVPQLKTGPSLTPQLDKPRYSPDEVKTFAKYLNGVEDPLSLIDDMKHGKISREKVEAVRVTSPKIYQEIQNQIIEQAGALAKKLPFDSQVQLSILFGVPVTQFMTPEFIRAMQQTTTTAPPAPEPKPAKKNGGGRRPIDLHSTLYSTGIPAKGEGA